MDNEMLVNGGTDLNVRRNENASLLRTFIPLVIVAFILNYVESMVIPSIPRLQASFNSTTAVSSWLVSAVLIAGCVASPLFGRLGDKFGKRKMLLVSFIFYTIGVGIAGFSPSMGFLIFSRALQGIGFGAIPLAFAIIIDIFPRERVASAQGIMSGMFATGGVAGLVAGSYIIQYLGWQWAFHSAFIASIVLIMAIIFLVKSDESASNERIDYLGASILTVGMSLVLLYITEGSTNGWTNMLNLLMFATGAVFLSAFLIHESRTAEPLIHLSLLAHRNVLVANLIGILSMVLMQSLFLSFVYFADDPTPFGDGFSIITTGLVLAPGAMVMAFFGPYVGRLLNRTGPKPLIMLGAVLFGIGLILFLMERSSLIFLMLSGVALWTGLVSLFVPMMNMIAMALPPERRAVGLGMNIMLRTMGGSMGPAVSASVMTTYSAPLSPAVAGAAGNSVITFPTAAAFNLLMVMGLVIVAIIMMINLGTRNYIISPKKNVVPPAE